MLTITIPELELFNEETNEFYTLDAVRLDLEHSLVSLSKWESKWEKPFLGPDKKSDEETLSYIEAMVLTPNFSPSLFTRFTLENYKQINRYIDSKMTATWFTEVPGQPRSREIVTAEIVYYWMTALNIPVEFESWHLNRLMTLVRVTNEKNKPKKNTPNTRDSLERRRQMNAARKQQQQTRG